MLAFGNKEFRNLQEQVFKNMKDIADMQQGTTVLADFGIKVVGQVEDASDLPDPAEYDGEYGDAYIVGDSEPYEYYIFTRAFEGQDEPSWFNLGVFPQPGPQGPKGDKGDTGNAATIAIGSISTNTLEPGQNASVSCTNIGSSSNAVYNFTFSIPKGDQGIQGLKGDTGEQGIQGIQGPQGQKGDPGNLYTILGQVDDETDLPDPSDISRTGAYLVGSSDPYDVYVIIGDSSNLEWINLGPIATTSLPTHLLTSEWVLSGTAATATLQDINSESGGHFVQVSNIIFCFSGRVNGVNEYYCIGTNDTALSEAHLRLNMTTGDWTITLSDVAYTSGTYTELIAGQAAQISSTLPNTHVETFSYQTSAGSADIGSGVAEVQKLLGNSYVLNQYISDSFAPANSIVGYTSTKTNGVIHVTGSVLVTSTNSSNMLGSYRLIGGHKYAFISDIKQTSNIIYKIAIWNYTASAWYQIISWNTIYTASTEIVEGLELYFNMGTSSIGDTIDDYLTLNVIDLTQMFGAGNEPATIAEFKALFPQDYIPYNTGEIIDSCPVQYNTVGYNQWDEDWELGIITLNTGTSSDGQNAPSTTQIRSKNYIPVIAGQDYFLKYPTGTAMAVAYYDFNKNFLGYSRSADYGGIGTTTTSPNSTLTIPSGVSYIRFYMGSTYGTTYQHDICIFLYWDGSKVTYEQYDAHSYPLPGITLRSAGTVRDELLPDGTLTRNVGVVDLGTIDWDTYSSANNHVFRASLTDLGIKPTANNNVLANAICPLYSIMAFEPISASDNMCFAISSVSNNRIVFINHSYSTTTAFKTAMSGVYLNYELATPTTTDTDTNYQVNTIIDDFGTQEIVDDSGDIVPGCMQIKYPVNLQGFLESLYSLTNGDPEKIQLVE